MEYAELRTLDDASLKKQLDDLEHEMFNLRFQRAAGQMPNSNRLGQVRRDIARVKTLMRERERAAITQVTAVMEAKAK
jgi:large subunit ribosomal protein L29